MGPGVKVTCGSRAIVRSQMIGPARLSGERQASLNESSEQTLANRPRREAKAAKSFRSTASGSYRPDRPVGGIRLPFRSLHKVSSQLEFINQAIYIHRVRN